MHKGSVNEAFVTTREAAQRLGVALRTVQLWVESGTLPAWKTAGGHRRVSRAAVEQLHAQRQEALHPAPRLFRVLLVDDDPKMIKLVSGAIQSWALPLTLDTAHNGFESLVRIGEQRPDLLISDLHMPGMDGFEMIRALRNDQDERPPLEILVLTGLNAQDIEQHGGLPPDVRVFNKPPPLKTLRSLLRARLHA
jgi:excisionase family DNA binding protein